MEIVIDAYNADEQAMGWYYYLQYRLRFPFTVTRIASDRFHHSRSRRKLGLSGCQARSRVAVTLN
jgi:hypothetical protein